MGLVLGWSLALAALEFDAQTVQALIEAVEAAFEFDAHNSRCRGDQSGRNTENLNKELVNRYRITVLGVQDDWFPERNYRAAQARLERDFAERLRALGGCAGAKAQGLNTQLRQRYEQALARLAARR